MQQQDFPQHSSTLRPSARHSINSPFVHRTFRQLPSTFCLSVENILCGSWTFHLTSDNFQCGRGSFCQVFMRQQNLQSSSVNIPCSRGLPSTCINFSRGCGTYRQLSVHPWDLSPTFRVSEGPSMNFPYVRGSSINCRQLSMHLRDYPSNFWVSAEHCVIFSKNSVRPCSLPSTSANFFKFSTPFVNIPCDRGTFRHIQSTFCAVVGLSATFCQLSVRLQDLSSAFHAAVDVTSTFLSSTFCASERPSVNFPYGSGAFRQISVWSRTLCQLSLRQHNLPSIFTIFL